MQVFLIIFFPFKWGINKLAVHFSHIQFFRKIGIMVYERFSVKAQFQASQKLLLEMFLDLNLAVLIKIYFYGEHGFWDSESSVLDKADVWLHIIMVLLIVSFVWYGVHSVIQVTNDPET